MAEGYKQTMNLPRTDFPMRAGLSQREPERLKMWLDNDVYGLTLKKNEGHETFVLHDGPPYANGPIHCGHALNKISKDIINRYWMMQGKYVPYIPGWDCHGQPIEHKVESELGTRKFNETPTSEIRALCREYAVKNIDVQRNGFKRLGVLGDWDNPYLTFTHAYDAADIEIFKAIFDKGAIYRGRKPVHWCKHCHTALAEAEIEYGPETGPSIYVAFALTSVPAGLEFYTGKLNIMIWTTTPWTLPANTGVIVHPEGSYVAVEHGDSAYIMARPLVETVMSKAGWEDYMLLSADGGEPWCVNGKELLDLHYVHPIFEQEQGRVLYGDFVGMDEGTGCVHTAPGHGVDDYNVGTRFGLPIVMPVDDDGRFYKGEGLGTGGRFGGMDTDEANPAITAWLKEQGTLVAEQKIEHSYPHCWRCKHPVIFRATDQWFVSMDKTGLRQDAMDAINNQVTWYPAHASRRIGSMVEQRPDWCISRQRSWGVPIPSFTCQDCGEKVMNGATLDAVIKLFTSKGSDAWFTDDPADYLGEACVCPNCGSHHLKADRDILDVWWDSGVSHTAVLRHNGLPFPADMYLEGSDQHRGWFQSALLTSVGAYGTAPYKNVVSQGFVLDGQGRKMSKSLGNVVAPDEVCDELGADILRLWVASTDSSTDVSLDKEILKRISDAYRRFRNTLRFLLSELYDFDPATDSVPFEGLNALDRMALVRMAEVHENVSQAYAGYRFNGVYRALYEYVVTELSNVYLDAVKDRTYCDAPDAQSRRSAQTVLAQILSMLVHDLQPILVFTCDEVMEYMPAALRESQTYAALLDWYKSPVDPSDPACAELLQVYRTSLEVRNVVTKAIEEARSEGSIAKSQDASVRVSAPRDVVEALEKSGVDLAEFFIVSGLSLHATEASDAAVSAEVAASTLERCPRCWNMRTLGEDGLCSRCSHAVEQAHDAE